MSEMHDRKKALIEVLRTLGVESIVIEYSGHGDSGQIDSVNAFMPGASATDTVDINTLYEGLGAEAIAMRVSSALLGNDDELLSQILEQFAYDALDYVGATDWVNNDGGQGSITIHVNEDIDGEEDGRIEIAHEFNETTATAEAYEL